MSADTERPINGKDWADAHLTPAPIPATAHVVHTSKPIDLAKVKRAEGRVGTIILTLLGIALILAAAAGTFLSLLGVQP